ncbi:MAG TPA: YdiU family protein [Rhodocyclaceae bacterium]|nr:YdiU family protein [Rhodocyclaceae bacterium]
MEELSFPFDNSYARDLPGFYVPWEPAPVPKPHLLFLNAELAEELRLGLDSLDDAALAAVFSGNRLPPGAAPIAQAYAGHQFGHFSPQLGDGRALLIGEVIDRNGRRRDIAFKGSGKTPFSRRGDGKAAVGPMLREVLIGEAMHALGIATTRALAVVGTGDPVYRERTLPGAVLTRVADSHLRVGTFEFFAANGEAGQVKRLADYAIRRHYPELIGAKDSYLEFLRAVTARQAALVAQWMGVGFIHGVMNTDNMSIAGETIDYGPCAFMEAYDPKAVFSSIDEYGRYAFENQPGIAQWNLARLAESLLPLLAEDDEQAVALATEAVHTFPGLYSRYWLEVMGAKLGLAGREEDDAALLEEWLALLAANQADFTLAWRRLADAAEGNPAPLQALICDSPALDSWLAKWQARCAAEDGSDADAAATRAARMRRANPWIVPRNHRVEEALSAASEDGNMEPFQQLLAAIGHPWEETPELAPYAEPAPMSFTGNYRTFCGT